MKKTYLGSKIICLLLFFSLCNAQKYPVNIVGFIDDLRSMSRHTTSFIQCLNQNVDIKLIKTRSCNYHDFPAYFEHIINTGIDLTDRILSTKTHITGVTVFTDALWSSWHEYTSQPNNSMVKIAYCVTEGTLIPSEWAAKINRNFDAIAVPDSWLVDVYKNSGVTVPIFILPLVLDLESLLAKPIKQKRNKPFVFGFSGGFWLRKNHTLLVKAFIEEFGDNPNVMLKMHGRFEGGLKTVLNSFENIKTKNITLEYKAFTRQEYEDFITSLDCYVLISKGEGFSITPREALAAGIPCILSDNTAHKTICASGYVCAIPSNIPELFYCSMTRSLLGYDFGCTIFDCTISDVRSALRNVYENYKNHLEKAKLGRNWVKQYCIESLKPKYLNLIKPKMVLLGLENSITDHYLMTNSITLFNKYQNLCKTIGTIFQFVESQEAQ